MIFWIIFGLIVVALLIFDLFIVQQSGREISQKKTLAITTGYIGFALLFALGIFYCRGQEAGLQFLTGYFIELSLSIDNLFVFLVIFRRFSVPAISQRRVLIWGILGALIMRGIMIAAGITLITKFHRVIFVFGAFLILTGVKLLRAGEKELQPEENFLVQWIYHHCRVTKVFHGDKFFVRLPPKIWLTPLFVVLVLVETMDIMFAIDSIPAVLAITTDPMIVYTSNIFAVLGLKSLYVVVAHWLSRIQYLNIGLALVLIAIGGKMLLNGMYGDGFVPTGFILILTIVLIGGSVVVSRLKKL